MNQGNILELFEQAVDKFSSNTAIKHLDTSISFAQLEASCNNLANFLLLSGAGKGSLVAIFSDETVEVITSIIAILKAGCVFVPLDTSLPEMRLQSMVEVAKPEYFITHQRYATLITTIAGDVGYSPHLVLLDQPHTESEATRGSQAQEQPQQRIGYKGYANRARPKSEWGADDMCYIYFTSGTTGKPKAIAGRMKGIDHFIRWEIETLELDESVRVSQLLPVTFDGSMRDIFVGLAAGGRVCIPGGREQILDAKVLMEWIEEEGISLIHCVPTMFRGIVNEEMGKEKFGSLKNILMAGEGMGTKEVERWMEVYGERVKLVNLYGTSETTMAKFAYFVKREDTKRRSIPIGKPITGAKALVVDEDGSPCPPGAVGEIYIKTEYRTLGYYNQPELTREVFVPNPLKNDPDEIVYKTGDMGRVLKDGNFEILGRKDQQVKIRGVRVEIGEIENLLRGHEAVKDVAIVDRVDGNGNKYLCAYAVLNEGASRDQLRDYLSNYLPDFMLPSWIISLQELPRTLSGKVDKRALPAPGKGRAGLKSEYLPPRTPVEDVLAGIWAQVLEAEQIGIQDNFFELGGHSLRATQVLSRVRTAFCVSVPLYSMFEDPTIAGLAHRIEAAMKTEQGIEAGPIKRLRRTENMPLSFAQRRLWLINQLDPGNPAYNIPTGLRLKGKLSARALEETMRELVKRHEVLRTTFADLDDEPVQIISEAVNANIPVVDLSEIEVQAREEEIQRLMDAEGQRAFDLKTGPLLRTTLARLGEEDNVILFTMHHIVSDGWSLGILMSEVTDLYEAFSQAKSSPLAELSIQYADFARWQREWLQGNVLENHLRYWKQQLSGDLPVLNFKTAGSRPATRTYEARSNSILFPKSLTADLKKLSQQEGATLFMTLLAAFLTLLHHHTDQTDIIVGTDVANRSSIECESLIGFFINQLVLRTDLSLNPGFRELIARTRRVALEAYAHQDLPFDKLVEELNPERNLSSTPLFQVKAILQNVPLSPLSLPGLSLDFLTPGKLTAKYDLLLNMMEVEEGLTATIDYSTDLFNSASVSLMLAQLEMVLRHAVAHPDVTLNQLVELLNASDKQQWDIKADEYKQVRRKKLGSIEPKPVSVPGIKTRAGL